MKVSELKNIENGKVAVYVDGQNRFVASDKDIAMTYVNAMIEFASDINGFNKVTYIG